MDIILASGSPRRRELMEMLGAENLRVIPAKGEEQANGLSSPGELVMALASAKAREIAEKYGEDAVVIGADTIVWHNARIFGKPKSKEEAAKMLRELSGCTHTVYTGVCLIKDGREVTSCETSEVTFRELTDAEISAYIDTGEPMDKAGAYGAQGKAALFVKKIDGDFFNVMGLPLCRLGEMLAELGVHLL